MNLRPPRLLRWIVSLVPYVLFLGVSLLGLILNKRTVRSNSFVIYKTTSMLCSRLGVSCENVVKQTMRLITYNTPSLTRNYIPCLGLKYHTLSRGTSPYRPYKGVPPPPPGATDAWSYCWWSLRKQPTFGDATTSFPSKWRLRNERKNPILMTRHYPDLGSASDEMSCYVGNLIQPIRSTDLIDLPINNVLRASSDFKTFRKPSANESLL